MHPDEERIQRFLHGELATHAESDVRAHLAGCAGCRDRVAAAAREEAEVDALLRHLDHAPPDVAAATIVAQARSDRGERVRWAAGILLALGAAGAVYAAPGSPLRDWLSSALDPRPTPAETQTPVAPPAIAPDAAGIAVAPGRRLVIIFSSFQPRGNAAVSLFDGDEVTIRAFGGGATFSDDIDRLGIDNEGSTATFEIRIPRDAPYVEIRLRDRRLFLKEGARVTSQTPADVRGVHVLPLRPAAS